MALIKLGETVVGIRGTIGGITFSQNQSGPYAKSWARPVDPYSLPQQTKRNQISRWARTWTTLTDEQRDAWHELADEDPEPNTNPLGDPISHSGFHYFVRCNVRNEITLADPLLDPPEGDHATRPVFPYDPEFYYSAPNETLVYETPYDEPRPERYVIAYGLPVNGPYATGQANKARYTGIAAMWSPAFDLNARFTALFGPWQNAWYLLTLYLQNYGGLRSIPWTATAYWEG